MYGNLDLNKIEGFEWDKGNLEHIKKHDVRSKECEEMFFNRPLILNIDQTHSQTEKRLRMYGITNQKRLLVAIITIRTNKIRVISTRDQNRKERQEFKKIGGENL